MPDIMVEKAGKDFMIIRHRVYLHRVRTFFQTVLFSLIFIVSCEPDLSDDPIQYVPFADIVINLTLPAYINLASDGGYVYVNGGAKGIILYRQNSFTYFAYERNCSFQPNDACATVDAQLLDMKDPCCGSTFSYTTGNPTSSPAWRPLNQYQTSLSGNTLTITDQLVE